MKNITPDTCQDASAHILDSIQHKRAGIPLESREIERTIKDFVAGKIPDAQMSAWLATIACVGMDINEIEALTRAYVSDGKRIDFSGLGRKVVDKHSTGGVGDKVTLVVVPIVAACGVAVAKISGRGLGHAGGTLDKLESIVGLNLDLDAAEARAIIDEVGMVMTGQSSELVPGDKATYKLRDVTGSVESIPLIAASIISKKVATGADALILDVKTGSGALIQDPIKAKKLAETMVELATRFGINCRALISDMNQPLGYAVGNILEVKEALAVLRGEVIPGLTELCCVLARLMLQVENPSLKDTEAENMVSQAISSGAAYQQFMKWANAQGADMNLLTNPENMEIAPKKEIIRAKNSGWIEAIEPRAIGNAALRVGAGRLSEQTPIDNSAGIILHRQVGDWVKAGDSLAELHYTKGDTSKALSMIDSAFTIGKIKPSPQPVVHQILGSK